MALAPFSQRGGYFNPRPLAGATHPHDQLDFALVISIHAPLRGRRSPPWAPLLPPRFQSTPPCGGDGESDDYEEKEKKFQSTPPCGGDRQ